MSILKLATAVSLAALAPTALHGEKRCPGNVPSVPLRVVQGALIVAPITINGSGPFDFVVDTGGQISTIDAKLAAQLGLRASGTTGVSGVASYQRRAFLQLNQMEIGGHRVDDVLAVIEDLAQLHAADAKIRGIVGEDYLTHFDLLIDNEHRMLCLDETDALASAMKGAHTTLEGPYGHDHDLPFTRPLVIAVQINGGRRPLLLRLDSGSNVPVIYGAYVSASDSIPAHLRILKRDADGVEQDFAVLSPKDVLVGRENIGQVIFVQPLNSIGAVHQPREDGVLPTQIFRRIFVSYTNQFAILDPR